MHYRSQAPRSAYAAFEFEGDSWNRYLASLPEDSVREAAQAGSHLVLIDVGLDPAALRVRHPDRRRVVITHATVGLVFRDARGAPPSLAGRVTAIFPQELSVPRSFRGVLEGVEARRSQPFDANQWWRGTPLQGAPRFRVSVTWGRSLEPWVGGIEAMPTNLDGKN
jgi:hypothetical protein